MTGVYDEVYRDTKQQQQGEDDLLRALHEQFDYYYDKEKMSNKMPEDRYSLKEIDDGDGVILSTDFTDSEEDALYKRYKMTKHKSAQTLKEYFA